MVWRTINKYDNYEVSKNGLIRDRNTHKYLKQYKYNLKNKVQVKVCIQLKSIKSFRLVDVARSVAEAYLEKPDDNSVLDFKDGNPLNCKASNLYYRDRLTNKEYLSQKSDDEYIRDIIKEYRRTYPNDYFISDEDLEQEFRLKIYLNKKNGVSRTMHFKSHIRAVHNMNGGNPNNINVFNSDCCKEYLDNERLVEELDKVEEIGYLKGKLNHYLDTTISKREKEVLKFRYGFFPNEIYKNIKYNSNLYNSAIFKTYSYSLDETGEYMGVSRERVRQIETKALRKLRHSSRLGKYIVE